MTKWLEAAWEANGACEIAGPGANPEIVQFFADAGHPEITSDETAWCAAFVGACLHRGGVDIQVPKANGKRLSARAWEAQGTPIDKARTGAIAIFTRGDPSGWQGHVGFVVGETETHIALLGGNQADKVSVAYFPKSKLIALRWPEPAKAPADLAESRIAAAAARQVKDAGKGGSTQVIPSPGGADALPSPEALAAKAQGLQGVVESLSSFAAFAGKRWPWIMAAIAIYYGARMAWDAWQIRQWRAQDASEGKTVA